MFRFKALASGIPEQDAQVPPLDRDKLYVFQLTLENPLLLDPLSFFYAGVVTRQRHSERIFVSLQRIGVIDHDGLLSTITIGPQFTHDLAFLSKFSQRRLIGVLFFWEEETQRLRQISDAEKEILDLVAGAIDTNVRPMMELELSRNMARKALRPSARSNGETEEAIEEALATIAQRTEVQTGQVDDPPAYSRF